MKKKAKDIKKSVKKAYAKIAVSEGSCCATNSCCPGPVSATTIGRSIGYSDEELNGVPEGANLGLGCGNPVAIASLKEGDVVLDLGSGAGFDTFLASEKVGKLGRVIGVDMTPEMIGKARRNARNGNYTNVEFRLGEIEKLPVADSSVDVMISNCVINLSPDKKAVFREAFRVLKPGGRLMVSDLVLINELPEIIKESIEAYVGCIAGAAMKDEYLEYIKSAGFQDIEVLYESNYPMESMADDVTAQLAKNNPIIEETDLSGVGEAVVSIAVGALKPLDSKGGNRED